MKESILIKVSISCALIGLLSLFILTKEINESSFSDFSNISVENQDQNLDLCEDGFIELTGIVKKSTNYNGTLFLNIKQEQSIEIVAFKSPHFTPEPGDLIQLRGKLEDNSIIADEIRRYPN
ncbi:hypothetical protein HOK51_09565 [Candidatus Woesearchaeota archaeon]|jgi:hypothetical protein|nr:hypothetical protein [Candidatus Woesearchaeota archaeon]MBT6520070.1 hypothetical protein [Candidatus Woesearchaeota archaeon]MBT7366675.1 hypothetical protein [Candidatus Woesearchaeota archaeon]